MSGARSGNDVRNSVIQATDIVELIGRTVALKRRGKDFVGLCPFHQEKTPSFHVSPAKQYFHCYGCKKGGNVIDFVIERDRSTFVDAMRLLAEAAGIEWRTGPVDKQKIGERQLLLEAQSAACQFFEKSLSDPSAAAARAYLETRGINADSVQRFQIGFAPPGWDNLGRSPLMKKFAPGLLALGGLFKPNQQGGHYDTFRHRLMFPIRDENSRVIAFGGRVLPGSEDPAKYLNSPETPLFFKGRCVFGIDLARQRIVETRTVAVVEGYTDVVMAHQYGVNNVVSVLGTALTEQHVALLRRFADRIVLLFDADAAGDNAVNRAVELFLTQPVEIAIASMPDGVDPDEFLLKEGADGFNKLLADATDALTYKWKQLIRRMKASDGLTGQNEAVQQYLQTLAEARGSGPIDALRWGAALTRVSRLTEIPVEDLNRRFKAKPQARQYAARPGANRAQANLVPAASFDAETAQDQAGNTPTNDDPGVQTEVDFAMPIGSLNARQRAEGIVIGLLLTEPQRWDGLLHLMTPGDFTQAPLRKIAEIYWLYQQDEGQPVLNEFLASLEHPDLKSTALHWVDEVTSTDDAEPLWLGSLDHLAQEKRREQEKKLIATLRRPESQPVEEVDPDKPASNAESMLAEDIANLRQLMEKVRQPDMRRVGS